MSLTHRQWCLATWCPRGSNHEWKGLAGPVQLSYPSLLPPRVGVGVGDTSRLVKGLILNSKVDQSFIQDLNHKKIFIFHLSL